MMNCAWFVLRRGQSIVTERAYNDIAFYPVKMCTMHDEKISNYISNDEKKMSNYVHSDISYIFNLFFF